MNHSPSTDLFSQAAQESISSPTGTFLMADVAVVATAAVTGDLSASFQIPFSCFRRAHRSVGLGCSGSGRIGGRRRICVRNLQWSYTVEGSAFSAAHCQNELENSIFCNNEGLYGLCTCRAWSEDRATATCQI